MRFEFVTKGQPRAKHAKPAVEEAEVTVPTTSLSDTSDAAELVAAIDHILGE